MSAKSYRKAVNTLRPSRAEMERRHAPYNAIAAQGKALAMEIVEHSGLPAIALYRAACDLRHNNETALDTATRVALLGMARKEGNL